MLRKGGRELASIEDSVDTSIQRLDDDIKKQRKTDYSDQKLYRQHKNQQKNGKKNNCMEISSDKQAKSYMKKTWI